MNSWRNLEFNKETNIISNFAFIYFIFYFTVNWYILKRYMICLDSRDRNGILVVYKSMTPNFNKTRQNPYLNGSNPLFASLAEESELGSK